ncbi:MAG: MerR family DNA-binding protein, partial [Henriciella sp.]
YQRSGLLDTPVSEADDALGRKTRRYGADHLRTLRFIRSSQTAGFTLRQIRELIELDARHDRKRARELAEAQIEILEEKICDLQAARSALQRLSRECANTNSGPCPILSAFEPDFTD